MNEQQPTSERVYRELSADEQQRLNRARAETEAIRDEIMAEGRIRKRALDISRAQVRHMVDALRAERERLGLSLADVEARSGLKRSALSRLENDPTANPTLLTLQRYASAIGMRVVAELHSEMA
ncbi:MAG: helix-turn-helix domain-containing protein [Planctomycetota bacterium]